MSQRNSGYYRCHYSEGILIPGCYGSAIYGKSHCTCPSEGKYERLLNQIDCLEQRIKVLEDTK